MYNSIEKEFKRISYHKSEKKFITIIVIVAIILLFAVLLLIDNITFQIFLILGIYLLVLISFYAFVCAVIKKQKNIKVNKLYKFKSNVMHYKQFVHDEDIINLGSIYERYKIDSLDKLSEVLRHYQTLITRNIKGSGEIIAFLSLIISLVALFSTDILENNLLYFTYKLAALLIAFILYCCVTLIISYMNLMFSNEELYKRIENITSEIYMEKLVG